MSFLCGGSHLLPSQLPGEHTSHKAASRCGEPIWNAHYSSTHHHCQVPILHLDEVRHTWSSHLAQGCYNTTGPSHLSHYGAMPAGWSPIHVINQAHDCLTSVIKHKMFTPCYVSPYLLIIIVSVKKLQYFIGIYLHQ